MAIKRGAEDIHFSKAVRQRDKTCQRCKKDQGLECAHIFGRANKAVRWSMDNALALCHYCHRYYTGNPVQFHDDLLKMYGEGHMAILREKSRAILKTNKLLRAEISKHYRLELKSADEDPTYTIVSWN